MNILIPITLLILMSVININPLHKRILYLVIIVYFFYNYQFESFTNLQDTNIDPIKSYDNIEHLTYDFYKKGYEAILQNNTTELDLEKYAWPTNFNPQSQDYLDKTRFIEVNSPLPTNPDFF